MLLGEPQRTAYDLNFNFFGFPVRVTPFFWVAALLLGQSVTRIPDAQAATLVLLWISAVFISIFFHELGHALAFRYYGISSHIVLYHFGGLAVPDGQFSSMGFGRQLNPKSQIVISAAGPIAQLLLAAFVILMVRVVGHEVPWPRDFPNPEWLIGTGDQIPSPIALYFVFFLILPSVMWALLNLLPVYPLDGGQIAREIFTLNNARDGIRQSLILSIITAGALVLYGLSRDEIFLAIMFGMLGYSSYQTLQSYGGRGGGFGGGSPW